MIARETASTTGPDGKESGAPSEGSTDHAGKTDCAREEVSSGPSPFAPLLEHLAELQMLVGHYLRARADQITARARMLALWLAVGIIGLIMGLAFVATAVVLVLRGIAMWLAWLGLPDWAADLITGVVCIVAVAAFLAIGYFVQNSAFRRKRRDDYQHFRARFRAKFGRSLDEAGRRDR